MHWSVIFSFGRVVHLTPFCFFSFPSILFFFFLLQTYACQSLKGSFFSSPHGRTFFDPKSQRKLAAPLLLQKHLVPKCICEKGISEPDDGGRGREGVCKFADTSSSGKKGVAKKGEAKESITCTGEEEGLFLKKVEGTLPF